MVSRAIHRASASSFTTHIFRTVSITPPLNNDNDNKEFSNEPVFYGPDGSILSEEENAFLWSASAGPNEGLEDEV